MRRFSILVCLGLFALAPGGGAARAEEWPAGCAKPKYSWNPFNWWAEELGASIGCLEARGAFAFGYCRC